jgi:putative membrane protein
MIIYNSQNWFKNIINFHRSYTIQQIFYGAFMSGVLTLGVVLLYHFFALKFHINMNFISLVGIALSILLVFRTNTAYDKWWEGRTQWGNVMNNSRNLAMLYQAILPPNDAENRAFFAKHLANFAFALKDHLRKGVNIENLIHLSETEKKNYLKQNHIPNFILANLYMRTQQIYQQKEISGEDILNIKPHLQILTDVLGACERIKKTPIPFSYNVFLKLLISVYVLSLPFSLVQDFGFFTIPIVMIVTYTFAGLEMMADEIEDPFGLDCNDLPTHELAISVKNNVYEILCIFREVEADEVEVEFEKIH